MTCLVVIVAPLAEELFFRVLLQGWLEDYGAATIVDIEPAVPLAAPRWPIVISAALFALMHLGQGPAPAPLFVLGLAMGYLYRQTHRITPPLVLHAFFNATSMLALALDSGSGPAG
jgi:membrane protease YdiL (CAAX protease family)